MTRIVLSHGGTVDKFIGDAVMAFWSAPVERPDHARAACRCALGCQLAALVQRHGGMVLGVCRHHIHHSGREHKQANSGKASNRPRNRDEKCPDVLRCPQMTGHGAKFGRRKEDAIVALLTTRTTEEAARAVNVSPKTLLRWQKEPEFDLAFRAAKRAAFGQAIGRLHHLSSAAVTTLGKVMLESATPPATRVRAADSILNHTTKAIEIEDLEARVVALEGAAKANQK
jgi:hypothetical protein